MKEGEDQTSHVILRCFTFYTVEVIHAFAMLYQYYQYYQLPCHGSMSCHASMSIPISNVRLRVKRQTQRGATAAVRPDQKPVIIYYLLYITIT